MKAGPKLLEPIMRVEVVTPEDYMGDVIGDLQSRRGQISGMDQRGNARVINAMVPLANMFGYVNTLRSMSQGRAQYTMHFDHYEQVPQAVADEVRAKMAWSRYMSGSERRRRWLRRSLSGPSRIATSGRSVMSITARRR